MSINKISPLSAAAAVVAMTFTTPSAEAQDNLKPSDTIREAVLDRSGQIVGNMKCTKTLGAASTHCTYQADTNKYLSMLDALRTGAKLRSMGVLDGTVSYSQHHTRYQNQQQAYNVNTNLKSLFS